MKIVTAIVLFLSISAFSLTASVIIAQTIMGIEVPWYSLAHQISTAVLWLIVSCGCMGELLKGDK